MEKKKTNHHCVIHPKASKDFVGLKELKERHTKQIGFFKLWTEKKLFKQFHHSHYDWFAFPIPERSSYGLKYSLSQISIKNLKSDEKFMKEFRTGVILLVNAWGYDLEKGEEIMQTAADQKWANWPVRLYKAGLSCQIFYPTLYQKMKVYAEFLDERAVRLEFRSSHLKKQAHVLKRWDHWEKYFKSEEKN